MARRRSEKIIEENNMIKITIDEQLDVVEGYKEFIHHEVEE